MYTYRMKLRVLEVRENEIAQRKLSGGTAQLSTLEETLVWKLCLHTTVSVNIF